MSTKSHLKGKGVLEHLREARRKGLAATDESHGIEAPGHVIGGGDAAKEAALTTLLIWIATSVLGVSYQGRVWTLVLFLFGLFLWKMGRSAVLGWERLERINKLIEEEKHEIEHNRDEEKAELTEIYRAKGLPEPLLGKVIDILMADDNKLLGVMLEEELGVRLESVEHPLKQAFGAGVGVLISGILMITGITLSHSLGAYFAAFIVIFLSSCLVARIERIELLHTIVWNLAITFLSVFGTYFLANFLLKDILLI